MQRKLMIIGPNGTNIVPKHAGFMLHGELGLMLLVLEAGLGGRVSHRQYKTGDSRGDP
jgi:hypothetical protein